MQLSTYGIVASATFSTRKHHLTMGFSRLGGNKWTFNPDIIAYVVRPLFPWRFRALVGTSGLEPPTSRLSGVCSNQLSYVPEYFCSNAASSNPRNAFASGGGKRDRTADPLLARQVLSQLSYTPKKVRPSLTENKCPDERSTAFIKNE